MVNSVHDGHVCLTSSLYPYIYFFPCSKFLLCLLCGRFVRAVCVHQALQAGAISVYLLSVVDAIHATLATQKLNNQMHCSQREAPNQQNPMIQRFNEISSSATASGLHSKLIQLVGFQRGGKSSPLVSTPIDPHAGKSKDECMNE